MILLLVSRLITRGILALFLILDDCFELTNACLNECKVQPKRKFPKKMFLAPLRLYSVVGNQLVNNTNNILNQSKPVSITCTQRVPWATKT